MKRSVIVIMALLSGVAGNAQVQGLRVRGTVYEAGTEAPLANVQVQLLAVPAWRTARVQGTTGADGTFLLPAVPPGNYVLAAKRAGYMGATYETAPGQTTLPVQANAANSVVLRMTRLGVVKGNVFRADGQPLNHQRVALSHFRTINGRRALAPEREVFTDAQGGFQVIGVPPGTYLLSAAVVQSPAGARRRRAGVPSYFPGVANISDAQSIEVGAGRTVKDISLKLQAPAVARRISGVLADEAGAPIAGAAVTARRDLGDGTISLLSSDSETTRTNANGGFVFPAMVQGTYVLFAKAAASGKWTAFNSVSVTTRDVNSVKMTASASATVEGRVVVEDSRTGGNPRVARISVRPETTAGFPAQPVATLAADGTFTMRGVPAGSSRFDVSLLSDAYYVKEVRVNGSDVSGPVAGPGPQQGAQSPFVSRCITKGYAIFVLLATAIQARCGSVLTLSWLFLPRMFSPIFIRPPLKEIVVRAISFFACYGVV